MQASENRINEARLRFEEAKKQLEQVNIVIGEIKNETASTKKILLKSDAYQARKDLKIRFERAFAAFSSRERQIFLEIKQQIISLALKNVLSKVQTNLGPAKQATLIDKSIAKLGGQL